MSNHQQEINQYANRLIESLINGTVYKNGEPSYYNGPIDELFNAVDNLRAALCEVSGEDDIDCHDCGEDTCVCEPDAQ